MATSSSSPLLPDRAVQASRRSVVLAQEQTRDLERWRRWLAMAERVTIGTQPVLARKVAENAYFSREFFAGWVNWSARAPQFHFVAPWLWHGILPDNMDVGGRLLTLDAYDGGYIYAEWTSSEDKFYPLGHGIGSTSIYHFATLVLKSGTHVPDDDEVTRREVILTLDRTVEFYH